ncbi:MAG: hypothetical protein DI547_15730 [Sphingobium sp.]|nr:MAG: hypothetical protein DI547_15730 [Sphingobium sp.]
MIVSWISHDNRKQRRAARARARRARINLEIHRVVSDAVGDHIVALTHYLITPGKARLDELTLIEAAKSQVVRYIGSDKASGEITAADIQAAREIAESERVVQILTRNLLSTDLADIQFEMAVVAGMAPGAEDPIEHIVISWREGEHPSPEQVEEVLDIVLAVAGLSRHQAYAVLHGDTNNDHLHVALNRVDPVTGERVQIGRNVERSIETLHQGVAIVEHRQGWAPQDQALYRADEQGCYDRETGTKVRDAGMLPCASHAERSRIRQWRAEQKVERKISPAARDYERRTGLESLQRRVIETAAPVLRESRSWDEVHRGLAAEGMRYTMLSSGAVIGCGGRTIAASAAWGGASAAKMVERLGAVEEAAADVAVAQFEDRLVPKLHAAAEKRRAREALRREQLALDDSIAHAHDRIGEQYRRQVAQDPQADTEELNDIRQRASADLFSLREAIRLLKQRQHAQVRRKRRALDRHGLVGEGLAGDQDIDDVAALLIGDDATPAPLTDVSVLANERYDIVETDDRRDYYRQARLAFVERRDRIEVHATDDDALRHALRLAQAKWGSVSAVGDGDFLDRIACLAVEEGITLTNPALQDRMARMRTNRELERQLAAIGIETAIKDTGRTPVEAPAANLPPVMAPPAVLADYAPDFTRWLERSADHAISRGRVEAEASAIYANPELRRQLGELESQQFEFATQLRRSAQRSASRRQEALARHHADWPDEPLQPFGRLPRLSDLTPNPEKLRGMVDFAPAPAANEAGIDIADSVAGSPPPADGIAEAARELDRHYRQWADRDRRRQHGDIARERAAALSARAGDPAEPPRHIARLLLREAVRARPSRSSFDRATNRRDAQEIAALKHDPGFAHLWVQARAQNPELLEHLRSADSTGDALGRVRLSRDRLDFAHVSDSGHDSGARPPLEWIEADLRKLDFTEVRLTRRDGLVGMLDPGLLDATHHNHVGLLYPQVQARLELELRLQHERDLAVLAKIAVGEITLSASIDLAAMPHASIGLPRGASEDERRHIATMAHDPDGFLSLRAAVRGEPPRDAPLHASPLASAWLRARGEQVAPVVMVMLKERLRVELPELAVERLGHRPVTVDRPKPRTQNVTREGYGRGD